MTKSVTPFLMFEGRAEEAINFYTALFNGAQILKLEKHGPEGPGKEGTVSSGRIQIAGQEVMFFDSPTPHEFTFTPAISFFVACETEDEISRISTALADNGKTLMPLGDYGFSRQFAWVQDRFGVSWQLNLE